MVKQDAPKQDILKILNLEDKAFRAFAIERSRGVFGPACTPELPTEPHHRCPPQSKAVILTRLITILATAMLATAVLFRSPSEHRTVVCIVVCVATTMLAIRTLSSGKPMWAILFLAVLGIFTPFQLSRFSHELISILDMMTLGLFAASPLMLRKSTMTVVPSAPLEKW